MSSRVLDSDKMSVAVSRFNEIESKLNNLSSRITASYLRLDGGQFDAIAKAKRGIKQWGILYDEQWDYLKALRDTINRILDESIATDEKAKSIMLSKYMEETMILQYTSNSADDSFNSFSSATKPYKNTSKNWSPVKGGNQRDYSNYSVVSGFDESYALHQTDYWADSCTTTADCIAASIKKGIIIEPNLDRDWVNGQGALWTFTKRIDNSERLSVKQKCEEVYNQIYNGNPVVLRYAPPPGVGHSVTAIGIRSGADLGNIQMSDILIVDPGDGKIKTADEVYSGYYQGSMKMTLQSDAFLRIPK